MVEDGLFHEFPVDAAYAMHNWPGFPVGTFAARDDAMMAAFGTFEIVVEGRGSHGAMPHEEIDPTPAACAIVAALHTIPSRNVSPLQAAVVSATQIHAGDAWNVIPERCVVRCTTRWFDAVVGATLSRRIGAISESVAAGYGCTGTLRYESRYPAPINHPAPAGVAHSVAAALPSGLEVVDVPPSMGAGDFAFMLEAVQGCYAWLGAAREGDNPGLHSPRFDFNDLVLNIGAGYWVSLVERCLGNS